MAGSSRKGVLRCKQSIQKYFKGKHVPVGISVVFSHRVSVPFYIWHSQLAFYVNLHRAVIGPSATLTGRWRPDIDLRRMLTGLFCGTVLLIYHPALIQCLRRAAIHNCSISWAFPYLLSTSPFSKNLAKIGSCFWLYSHPRTSNTSTPII